MSKTTRVCSFGDSEGGHWVRTDSEDWAMRFSVSPEGMLNTEHVHWETAKATSAGREAFWLLYRRQEKTTQEYSLSSAKDVVWVSGSDPDTIEGLFWRTNSGGRQEIIRQYGFWRMTESQNKETAEEARRLFKELWGREWPGDVKT